jgi:glutathione S-transferase
MLTIHGRITSVNVQKVVVACEEMRIPYLRKDAGGAFGIVKTDEYKAMNPNSLVPVIVEDDFVLWESNSIVRYLAAKYGKGTVCPDDLRQRALSDRWMDWQMYTFFRAYNDAFWGLIRTPEAERDIKKIEASVTATHGVMAILDKELAGKSYLVGDKPTIGEIALVPMVFRWLNMPVKRPPAPNVEAWVARCAARPGWDKALLLPIT